MNAKPVKQPSPDHPISIVPISHRIVVTVAGRTVADTQKAILLHEANYPAVAYIPRQDVDMSMLTRSELTSYCPYKGDCAYYSIPAGGAKSANAAWTYGAPYPAVAQIAEFLAFYPRRVDAITGPPAA